MDIARQVTFYTPLYSHNYCYLGNISFCLKLGVLLFRMIQFSIFISDAYDPLTRAISLQANIVVISVEYVVFCFYLFSGEDFVRITSDSSFKNTPIN